MTSIDAQLTAAQHERVTRRVEKAKRWVWVHFQKEGIHCYPAAATNPALSDVSFLASPHRHIFHFTVQVQVMHNDRDVEFILLKRWCESLYDNGTLELNAKSCEMMADDLYYQIGMTYPGRDVIIKVSEDLENGCTIEYTS